jgi:hypothetical protein
LVLYHLLETPVFQYRIYASRRGTKATAQTPFVRGNERKIF